MSKRNTWGVKVHDMGHGWRTMPYTDSGTIGGTAPRHLNLLADLPDSVLSAAIDTVHGDANAVEVRLWGGALDRSATATCRSR